MVPIWGILSDRISGKPTLILHNMGDDLSGMLHLRYRTGTLRAES